MKPNEFTSNKPGDLVPTVYRNETGWAFLPDNLPPNLTFDQDIAFANERAAIALGNLNGSGRMLPNPTLLLRPFMSREALASSRIEGTRAEYGQLLILEASDQHQISDPDYQEVHNYITTLNAGWDKPADRSFSTSFLMELHGQLLQGVRGSTKDPGKLRDGQVLIGSALDNLERSRFVPPPPEFIRDLVDQLCEFIEQPSDIPALVRIALIHYQFETIHPFQDGNGRLGRLILPIILGLWGDLDLPLLYLSEFFEEHKEEYVDRMLAVSQKSAWKEWILFTLKAIEEQSNDAVSRGQKLLTLRESYRQHYQSSRSTSVVQIIDLLFERPSLTIAGASEAIGITRPAAAKAIATLEKDGVLREETGFRRNRVFLAPEIIQTVIFRQPAWSRNADSK